VEDPISRARRSLKSHDPLLSAAIESAAVDTAWSYYEEEMGFNVETVEDEHRGWDLNVTGRNGTSFCVEVKGTQSEAFVVDLTPREYEQMKRRRADR
jgi:hypothetical protein